MVKNMSVKCYIKRMETDNNKWSLFLDDVRDPAEPGYTIARSSQEANELCAQQGLPCFMSLDHDLGGEDNALVFLKSLYETWVSLGEVVVNIPDYQVHSANPIGSKNIISFMESWKRSVTL